MHIRRMHEVAWEAFGRDLGVCAKLPVEVPAEIITLPSADSHCLASHLTSRLQHRHRRQHRQSPTQLTVHCTATPHYIRVTAVPAIALLASHPFAPLHHTSLTHHPRITRTSHQNECNQGARAPAHDPLLGQAHHSHQGRSHPSSPPGLSHPRASLVFRILPTEGTTTRSSEHHQQCCCWWPYWR